MSTIETTLRIWDFSRGRTLALLDDIAGLPDPRRALGWRPKPGRAHMAWQLMHIGITEELFATERLLQTSPEFSDLIPRFKGGSTPDDDIPAVETIREVLDRGREHLRNTVAQFREEDLAMVPEPLQQRGWSVGTVLQVLTWHEPHHQGQAHVTFNLWKAAFLS